MITLPAKIRGILTAAQAVRSVLVAALAIAVFAGAASFASASCGDWLANPGDNMPAAHASTSASQLPAGNQQALLNKSHLPAPCNGPMCGKAPEAPSPAVPASALERVDRISLSIHSLADDASAGRFGLSSDWDAQPVKGFPSRLDHPPRA